MTDIDPNKLASVLEEIGSAIEAMRSHILYQDEGWVYWNDYNLNKLVNELRDIHE